MEYIFCILGTIMVIEGLPYLLFPGKAKEFLRSLTEKPDQTLRLMGISLMATGLFIIWVAKR
ncbi:MAG: DUF2065 domain-containing protein [Thermodesulfobacteriota bacterium]